MITVRLPASLRIDQSDTLALTEDVRSIADLIDALDRRTPGFRKLFDEGGCNFAVNDEIILHRVRDVVLRSGDVVEIVLTISGGRPSLKPGARSPEPEARSPTKPPAASGRLKRYANREAR